MKYMTCTACKKTVQSNNTGICFQCQGFLNSPQKDSWQKKESQLFQVLKPEKLE